MTVMRLFGNTYAGIFTIKTIIIKYTFFSVFIGKNKGQKNTPGIIGMSDKDAAITRITGMQYF